MRFDPRVVPAEQPPLSPDGEVELPDDLAALAEQLGEDAARLAACYPPVKTTHLKPPSARSWRKRMVIAAAAFCGSALAIAISIAVVSLGPSLVATRTGDGNSAQRQSSYTSVSPASEATVSLVDLSGPELEAWLDLHEREPAHPISVSF